MEETVLAIDPGRDKCGIAVVQQRQGAIERQLVRTSEAVSKAAGLIDKYSLCKIILGDSTYSKIMKEQLEQNLLAIHGSIEIILVNEYRSTDEARMLYWRHNPPAGWRRLLPVTMQTPPVPVDDYAAIVLAERYFNTISSRS